MIELLVLGFWIVTATGIVILALANSWYDISATWRKQRYSKRPGARRFRPRPIVTVIVTSAGDTAKTQHSLDSILKSSYRKRKVIVVGAKKRDFQPASRYRTVTFAKNDVSVGASRAGLHIEIPGGVTIPPSAISNAVWHLNDSPDSSAVMFARQPSFYPSQASIFSMYYLFLNHFLYKAMAIFGQLKLRHANLVLWKAPPIDEKARIVYAEDATFVALPATKFSMLLKTQHLEKGSRAWQLYALLCLLVIVHGFVMALWLRQPIYLFITLAGFTLLMVMTIWWNNVATLRQKFAYIALLPLCWSYLPAGLLIRVLEMAPDMTKAVIPVSIGLFVRIKNIFRIVE